MVCAACCHMALVFAILHRSRPTHLHPLTHLRRLSHLSRLSHLLRLSHLSPSVMGNSCYHCSGSMRTSTALPSVTNCPLQQNVQKTSTFTERAKNVHVHRAGKTTSTFTECEKRKKKRKKKPPRSQSMQ